MTRAHTLYVLVGCVVVLVALLGAVLHGHEPDAELWQEAWQTAEPALQVWGQGTLEDVQPVIKRLMKQHPEDWRVQAVLTWLLGKNQLLTKQYEGALRQAEALEKLLTEHAPVPKHMANLPRELRVRTYLKQGRFEETRKLAAPWLADPSQEVLFTMGVKSIASAYAGEGNYQEAEAFVRKQAEQAPTAKTKGLFLADVAQLKFQGGDKEGALGVLDEVIRDYPQVKDRAQIMRRAMSRGSVACACGCGSQKPEEEACAKECCAEEDKPAAKEEEQDKP